MFIEARVSETKGEFRGEEATGESLSSALLWYLRNVIGKK